LGAKLDIFSDQPQSLRIVPVSNRIIEAVLFWDPAPMPSQKSFRVELIKGAVDTNQRIYIRPETPGNKFGVSVFQADKLIGVLARDPRAKALAKWLFEWFDGGLFIVSDFSWEKELTLYLELFEDMSCPGCEIRAIDLLPATLLDGDVEFIFNDLPDFIISKISTGRPTKILEPLRLLMIETDVVVLEVFGMLSLARKTPEGMSTIFRKDQQSLWINSSLLVRAAGNSFAAELSGSFRRPTLDSQLLVTLPTFKEAMHNFSEEFDVDFDIDDFY
jgi:hypothetical protein